MSELTECNHCSLKFKRRDAKKSGHKITLRQGLNGGWDIYRHPRDVKIPAHHKHYDYGEDEADKYWIGWYMDLSAKCCC